MSRHNAAERLREKFRPDHICLLFVGESPPASGRFFYRRDSGLYRAMRDTFHKIDPAIDDDNFLTTFQAMGHYLIDLCPEPVDHLDPKPRRAACKASEASLTAEILRLQPEAIATLLKSIESNVARAVSAAGWSGPMIHLPYPGRWQRHREAFTEALIPALSSTSFRPATGTRSAFLCSSGTPPASCS